MLFLIPAKASTRGQPILFYSMWGKNSNLDLDIISTTLNPLCHITLVLLTDIFRKTIVCTPICHLAFFKFLPSPEYVQLMLF